MNKPLNQNNFLRWEGSFKDAPFENVANNDTFEYTALGTSFPIVFDVLANDVSTFGIDPNSFEFVTQINPAIPAVWNSATKKVTFFPMAEQTPGDYTFQYRWRDVLGNQSNIGIVTVTVNEAGNVWVLDYTTAYCEVDASGNHTGMLAFERFMAVDEITGLPVIPAEYKPNVPGGPDYVPPIIAGASCPIGSLPVNIAFLINISTPGDVDPLFRLDSFELRRTFDNGLVKDGILNLAANSNTSTASASGTFDLILELTGGASDGVTKQINVTASSDVPPGYVIYPPVTYTGVSPVVFSDITSKQWIIVSIIRA